MPQTLLNPTQQFSLPSIKPSPLGIGQSVLGGPPAIGNPAIAPTAQQRQEPNYGQSLAQWGQHWQDLMGHQPFATAFAQNPLGQALQAQWGARWQDILRKSLGELGQLRI